MLAVGCGGDENTGENPSAGSGGSAGSGASGTGGTGGAAGGGGANGGSGGGGGVNPACSDPAPIRYDDIRVDLQELLEVLVDGSLENGQTELRIKASPHEPNLADVQTVPAAGRTGQLGLLVQAGPSHGADISVRALVDKGYTNVYSMWIRSPDGPTDIVPVLTYENALGDPLGDAVLGQAVTVGNNWTEVTLSDYAMENFDWAQFGLVVGATTVLHIDDFSVKVPVWKAPTITGDTRTVGGIEVPAEPIAPVYFTVLIHLEDPQELLTNETFYRRKTAVFEEIAAILHAHGGALVIQPELEWTEGAETFWPGVAADFATNYDVTYSTHTHGPACVDDQGVPHGNKSCAANPNWSKTITDEDILEYITTRVQAFETASGTSVTDHNGQWDWASFYQVEQAGILTVTAYKYDQRSFDTLLTNPWRPSETPPKTDPDGYLVHNPQGPVIYLPGVGQSVTKYDARLYEEVSRYMAQYIAMADPNRVNTTYILGHVDQFYSLEGLSTEEYLSYDPVSQTVVKSAEFEAHVQYWDDLMTNLIEPLVQEGYLQWATTAEMGQAFVQWEQACGGS